MPSRHQKVSMDVEGERRVRVGSNAMKYTPGSQHWGSINRDPIDTFGIVSQSQTRHASHLAASSHSQKSPARTHKLGFASSADMPVIQQPRVLFDAFQDVTRSGPLPAALREGSMPLYFSLNKKYLSQYDFQQRHGPNELGQKQKNIGRTAGAIHRELIEKGLAHRPASQEQLLGDAELTMGRKLLARPTTSMGLTGEGGDAREIPGEMVNFGESSSLPVWQVMRSETKGFPYWYNRITGESRWTQPHDSLETINSKSHVSMPEDRTWFNYQGNFYGRRPENSSTGMTSAQMSDLRIKPDFVVEHQRGYKKTLQRRLQMPDEGSGLLGSGGAGEGGMRATLRGSPTIVTREELEDVTHFPEKFNAVQSGASWEGKLLRLIVQKCEEHSGRAVSMRETFLRLDKDKVGWVSKEDLREVLQNYTGMTLSNRDMVAVENMFCGADGKIRYLDVCRAMSGDGVHPLGGPFCVNIGSSENQDAGRGFEKIAIPNKSGTRLMVDLTAK